jgi:cytochrome c-type biogenesis protein CcmH
MVQRLADRLKQNGSDAEGWAQLVRSYRTLGQNDKADAAIADARRALVGDPDRLRVFTELTEKAAPAVPAAPPAPPAPAAPATGASGPSAADIAAATKLQPDQQNDMVRSMVTRLADRLKQNGNDIEGWQRLVRAYMVLGERDKAQAAADDAKRALASDADKLRQIDDMIKSLGLQG